jgi:hypothetical protein
MDILLLQSAMSKTLTKATHICKHWLERGQIKCFEREQHAKKAVIRKDVGVQIVPVAQIVGSVGRCHDFDSQFRFKKEHSRERFEHIKQVMHRGQMLPPVELYKLQEDYYVLDGNHQVATAKELGQLYLDAYMIEYLSS